MSLHLNVHFLKNFLGLFIIQSPKTTDKNLGNHRKYIEDSETPFSIAVWNPASPNLERIAAFGDVAL